ncbi:MAG TPA: hypothetical protein VMO26_11270 [Vicinamibacterales bacterium]|nr:hypothetical protein [Vicinamibacterales bacterium]
MDRLAERGASEDQVVTTIIQGERFPAKFDRVGFRRNFSFDRDWRGRHYTTKEVEDYAVQEQADWLVITVIVKYFGERVTP